jgi:Tfp pilus assembly protein PilO
MAADYQTTFRRYGRFYKNVRRQMKRKEVLVSTNIILTLFTISFFAVFAIRPTALTISGLWREINDKKNVQSQLEGKISNLSEAQSALESMEEDLQLLENAIPATAEFSRLVKIIEYLASDNGLVLSSNSFSNIKLYQSAQQATASAAQIETHSFSVGLRGTFSDLGSFINDLEQLDRLISITSLTIHSSKRQVRKGVFDLEVSLRSDTYSFPEGAELGG